MVRAGTYLFVLESGYKTNTSGGKAMTFRDKLAIRLAWLLNLNSEKRDRAIKRLKGKKRLLYRKTSRQFAKDFFCLPHAKIEIYTPKQKIAAKSPAQTAVPTQKISSKIVYFLHGGAFITPLISLYRNLYRILSKCCEGAAIAMLDYRTAPLHTYPAAHDDAMDGYEFLLKQGYSPKDIIIMGDSAGGNLTLSLLLRLRDAGKELPGAAITISAWTDLTASSPSYKSNYRKDAIFGRRGNGAVPIDKFDTILKSGVYCYTGEHDRTDPYLSPFFGEYKNMPPILMIAGEHELPLDDTLVVADKIRQAGGNVDVVIGKGMFHDYPLIYRLSPIARQAFNEIEKFIKKQDK